MKVYRVIDDGDCVLTTTDRLKMLEQLLKVYKKYENDNTFYWVDEEEI